MALVAERVAQIEEEGVVPGDVVPERNRIHEIKNLVDYESGRVLVEFTKARDDTWEHWDVIREVVRF